MVTQEQGLTPIMGLNVYDAILISNMIDKLLQRGLVTGREIAFVAAVRGKVHMASRIATGVDLDNPEPASAEVEDDG